jgi:hypothetical protein
MTNHPNELITEPVDEVGTLATSTKDPTRTTPPHIRRSSRSSGPTRRWSTLMACPGSRSVTAPAASSPVRSRTGSTTSPELAAKATVGGVFRKGLWGNPKNKNPPKPDLWQIYPQITAAKHAASDHAAVWVDLDL